MALSVPVTVEIMSKARRLSLLAGAPLGDRMASRAAI